MAAAPRRRLPDNNGIQGVYHNQKQKAFAGFFWGRCFEYDGGIGEEKVLGWNSTGRAIGTQPTKFQAENVHRDTESKEIARSVVSKFFWNVRRERKRLSESGERLNITINSELNRATNDGEYLCRSSTYPRESRHMSEDLETFCNSGNRVSSKWGDSSYISKIELPNLQSNAAGVPLTDDDNYGSSPKSLLDGHFSDIKIDPVSTRPVLKPCDSSVLNVETSPGKYGTSCFLPVRKDQLLLEPSYSPIENLVHGSEECQMHKNYVESKLPTGIVVLQPNLLKEHTSVGGEGQVPLRRKLSLYNEEFQMPVSHEASEIARSVTRRTREACVKFSCSRRYSRCQDLYQAYRDEFGAESDVLKMRMSCDNWRCSSASFNAQGKLGLESQVLKLPLGSDKKHRYPSFRSFSAPTGEFGVESEMLRFPLRCKTRCRHPSSGNSTEWSSNMINKRVSERWKVTDRFRELEFGDCGQTLAKPGGEAILEHLSSKSKLDTTIENQFGGYNRSVSEALGMRCCDGRKANKDRILSRSRSFPLSGGGRSQRKGIYNSSLLKNKHMILSKLQLCGRNKHLRGSTIRQPNHALPLSSNSRISMSPCGKPGHFNVVSAQFELKMEASIKNFCEQPVSRITEIRCNSISDAEQETTCTSDKEDLCTQYHEASNTSSENPRGTGDTVLILDSEAPFKENESSGVENAGDPTTEMNELQEQPKHVGVQSFHCPSSSCSSSTWDFSQLLRDISPDVEGWECSFALKVLAQCGVDKSGLDKICTFWRHMPDYHRNPSVLDKIEKKGIDGTTRLRSERMFLLDRINIAIMDRFRQQVDICPWVKPRIAGFSSFKDENALAKLIRKEATDRWLPERLRFDPEMVWGDPNQIVDIIGNEIESLLTDDLLSELLLEQ